MSRKGKHIDWEQVHTRLRNSQLALDQALTASPERREAVYRERAAQLAARQAQAEGPETTVRVLTFLLGTERYGLELADLLEILPYARCTPVPGGPPQLLGVMNVHGEIRSVIDLPRLLELPTEDYPTAGYVLRVCQRGRAGGFRVDGIETIQRVAPTEVVAPEGSASGSGLSFLKGLTPDRLRLLNTDALLGHALFTGS